MGSPKFPEPILHVDMDAFFVEVERLRNPALAGRPVVVGGSGPRGVVASASYEAREYGVKSAMPMARARRLCPGLVVVSPDHAEYRRVSGLVFEIFRSVTPYVEGLSIDEAFLDVSGLRYHHLDSAAVGQEIRASIRSRIGLPSSVGVASNKFLAKLASGKAKPDGILAIPAGTELDFLERLSVQELWGVGVATRSTLDGMGISTVGDLREVGVAFLERRLGASVGQHLHELALGRDPRPVEPDQAAKSISVEETFDRDVADRGVKTAVLRRQADRLAARLHAAGVAARTVTLKVRLSDFTTLTRTRTRKSATFVGLELYRLAVGLLDELSVADAPMRLLGIGAAGLESVDGSGQLALGDRPEWSRLEESVEAVRDRFGFESVVPARIREPRGKNVDDHLPD